MSVLLSICIRCDHFGEADRSPKRKVVWFLFFLNLNLNLNLLIFLKIV